VPEKTKDEGFKVIPEPHAAVAPQDWVVEPTQSAPPLAGAGLLHERESVLADCPQAVGQVAVGLQPLHPPATGVELPVTQELPLQEVPETQVAEAVP